MQRSGKGKEKIVATGSSVNLGYVKATRGAASNIAL